jgi:hypothetical protein
VSTESLNFLTIVTFGRSGSTTLQAALNAHSGVAIRGENYNAFAGLWRYWNSIQDSADRHHSGKSDHPWFGTAKLNPQSVLRDLQVQAIANVLRPKPTTQWTGFKEVRYEKAYFPDPVTLLSYLLFLQELFPGLVFLINTRDPALAAKSGWWSSNPNALQVLQQTNFNLERVASDLEKLLGSHRVQIINHDQWKHDSTLVTRALAQLGFPVQDQLISTTLSTHLLHGKVPVNGTTSEGVEQ